MWFRLPHFPLILSDDNTLRDIKDKLGLYIDQVELKGNSYYFARMCGSGTK
jgi:hypothetical protein